MKQYFIRILEILCVTFFAAMVIVVSWQVITRQLLHSPSTWSEELGKLLFVWLTFLGGAFLFGERGHIAVDFVARRFSPNTQRYIQAGVQVIIFIFAVVGMVWGGIVAASNAWGQNLTALPFTIGWVYVVIPIAGVCIAYFAIADCYEVLTGKIEPYPDPDAAEEAGVDPTNIENESILEGGKK